MVPWLPSSRSERHVLQSSCQPTPIQPIYNREGVGDKSSGRKYKDRLIFILMHKRSLYSRPVRYDINQGYIYLSICPSGRNYKGCLVFILMYKRSLYSRPERYDINKESIYLSIGPSDRQYEGRLIFIEM